MTINNLSIYFALLFQTLLGLQMDPSHMVCRPLCKVCSKMEPLPSNPTGPSHLSFNISFIFEGTSFWKLQACSFTFIWLFGGLISTRQSGSRSCPYQVFEIHGSFWFSTTSKSMIKLPWQIGLSSNLSRAFESMPSTDISVPAQQPLHLGAKTTTGWT